MKTDDIRTYEIQILGRVEADDINRTSPVPFTIEPVEETNTSLTLRTDQSGMIGLIRHLHGMGLMLVSMSCRIENLPDNCSTSILR